MMFSADLFILSAILNELSQLAPAVTIYQTFLHLLIIIWQHTTVKWLQGLGTAITHNKSYREVSIVYPNLKQNIY